MINKTFNRYIWLFNTLLQHKRLNFKEIQNKWLESGLDDGKGLSVRTFHQHKDAIEELFDVEIKCDSANKYRYFIATTDILRNDLTRKWLLNSFTLSNMIAAGHNMKDRILFEDIPYGTEYLQTIIESMQKSKVLEIGYQQFESTKRISFHFCPYAMKVYRQRWYILGYIVEQKTIRTIALDRIIHNELTVTNESFIIPEHFSAKKYFSNTIGVYVAADQKPVKVKIRVYGSLVEYIRTLPLHHSQCETNSRYGEFCDFEYRLCITPELYTSILSMGNKVEVIEPQELRDGVIERLKNNLKLYDI